MSLAERTAILFLLAWLPMACAGANAPQATGVELSLVTADGVTVHGDVYMAENDKTAPLVLLFHQAGGDSRGEYGPIIPRLLEHGYNVMAVDQRVGGSRFGGSNRTVEGLAHEATGYCAAYPDLEATLKFASEEGFTGPTVAWGSSYSAALVLRLGAEHGDALSGVLSFSPASGPSLADCHPDDFADKVKIPALLLRPAAEVSARTQRLQFERFHEMGLKTHIAQPGTHGSSMLVAERVDGGQGVEETWQIVLEFLEEACK